MDRRLKADGFALLRLREDALLTQAELAARAGVHEVTVHKIEAEKVKNPRAATLRALARALDVPVALLYRPEKEDEGEGALYRILRERALERELAIASPDGAPSIGRYGAAWDFELGGAGLYKRAAMNNGS
jgi:transcriptional regulator with XRE-family HTH domain